MDNPYLLKVLLCESIDRLKALDHVLKSLQLVDDKKVLMVLKQATYMTKAIRDTDKAWSKHKIKCEEAHDKIRKEAIKRKLIASQDDVDSQIKEA